MKEAGCYSAKTYSLIEEVGPQTEMLELGSLEEEEEPLDRGPMEEEG